LKRIFATGRNLSHRQIGHPVLKLSHPLGSKNMSYSDDEAAVAAFIQTRGITRCPTACVVRTQGTVSPIDQEALRRRAAEVEMERGRRRFPAPLFFGKKRVARH
jgi:hypothetical protein